MLSAGAAGAVSIHPQIVGIDLHIQILFNIRHHVAGNKRGLALSVGVERRNPHQAVNAAFRLQIAIGVFSIDLERDRFHTGFLAVHIIQDFR